MKNFKPFKILYRNDSNNLSYKSNTSLQFSRFRVYLFEIAVQKIIHSTPTHEKYLKLIVNN